MKTPKASFKMYTSQLFEALSSIDEERINALEESIFLSIKKSSSIFLIGNGGSHANASHVCGDYLKTFTSLGVGITIMSPMDNCCYYSAAINDFDQTEAVAMLMGTLIKETDQVIYLSGSGNSVNLIKAAKRACSLSIRQHAIVGFEGGALLEIIKNSIHVPIHDMEAAEDSQVIIMHYIKQRLCGRLIGSDHDGGDYAKYNKRVLLNEVA